MSVTLFDVDIFDSCVNYWLNPQIWVWGYMLGPNDPISMIDIFDPSDFLVEQVSFVLTGMCKKWGPHLEDHPRTCKWLITMVIVFVP